MIYREDAEHILKTVLAASTADETQVTLKSEDLNLTRFNENWIHQNLQRLTHSVTIKVVQQKRIGTAIVSALDDASLQAGVKQALHNAHFVQANPALTPMPAAQPVREMAAIYADTLKQTPADRAAIAAEIIDIAKQRSLTACGSYYNTLSTLAVANSNGVMVYHSGNYILLRIIMNNGLMTGYADQIVLNASALDHKKLAEEAAHKALLRTGQASLVLTPGEYDTVFAATAVADLIRFPAMIAWGGTAFLDGRSFMTGRIGEKVFGDNITVYDDAFHPMALPMPFDAEGMPKTRVSIIEKGIAKGVVYDNTSGGRAGCGSSGHAGERGDAPSHMILLPGNSSEEEMIRSTKHGVYMTRFHYTHCPEPMQVVGTGTTRDGTFLIENGEIVARLKNLRYTESMIRTFSNVEALGREVRLTRDWWSSFISLLPAMKVNGFTFTGNTTF